MRPADYLLTPLGWGMVVAMPVVTLGGVVAAALTAAFATQGIRHHPVRMGDRILHDGRRPRQFADLGA